MLLRVWNLFFESIKSACPDWMQYHIEDIILFRLLMPHKVLANVPEMWLQAPVLGVRNAQQNGFQVRDILFGHCDGERIPVKYIAKRENKIVGNQDRDTVVIDRFNYAGAVDLKAHGTYTVLAGFHVLHVRHLSHYRFWDDLKNLHVRVFVFPVCQKSRSHPAVHLASKEGQDWTFIVSWSSKPQRQLLRVEVNFREGYIFAQNKLLTHVCIAHHFYCIPP